MLSLNPKAIHFNGFVRRSIMRLLLVSAANFSAVYSDSSSTEPNFHKTENDHAAQHQNAPSLEKHPVESNRKEEPPFPFPIDEDIPLQEDPDRFYHQFIRMLGTLGLLIGFMIFASWFLKKLLNSRTQHINTSSYIKVIESRPISNRSTLHLVESQGKAFIVGESATGLCLIVNYDKPFAEIDEEA